MKLASYLPTHHYFDLIWWVITHKERSILALENYKKNLEICYFFASVRKRDQNLNNNQIQSWIKTKILQFLTIGPCFLTIWIHYSVFFFHHMSYVYAYIWGWIISVSVASEPIHIHELLVLKRKTFNCK